LTPFARNYCGVIEEGISFTCARPFVLMHWPQLDESMSFETEADARHFIEAVQTATPYATLPMLYGFANGKWVRI
jgi:hypothetical protein